jgi:hypothetical protein
VLLHTAGLNLSLVMRQLCGLGKPKALQGRAAAARAALQLLVEVLRAVGRRWVAKHPAWSPGDTPFTLLGGSASRIGDRRLATAR